jgi:hypothetical protein
VFLEPMTSCGFHILRTAQIWRLLASGYSGVLKPPWRSQIRWTRVTVGCNHRIVGHNIGRRIKGGFWQMGG